jgi:hypothetical protein
MRVIIKKLALMIKLYNKKNTNDFAEMQKDSSTCSSSDPKKTAFVWKMQYPLE